MTIDASEVRVAITGRIYTAPVGTALPESATEVLGAEWVDLGYASTDGVTESYEESQTSIAVWQNGDVVRRITTESEARLAFTLVQTNRNTLEVYHKTSVMEAVPGETGQYRIAVRNPGTDVRSWVIDVVDGGEHIRIVAERAEVTERGEINYINSEAVGYPLTVTAYPVLLDPDNDVNGPYWKYSNSPSWAVEVEPDPNP